MNRFAPQLNTMPVFTAQQIALQRRMRFNPLRMLNPEFLSMALDQFDIGILQPAAQLWDAMILRDDTLSFVVPQFENSITGKPWGVFKRKNTNPMEAARHAAALEYFYSNVTAVNAFDRNERGDRHLMLKQMSSAYTHRYALHHFVWKRPAGKMIRVEGAAPVPALSAEMEFVPLRYFENTTGALRFLPQGGFGAVGRDMNFQGEWICTTGPGAMFAASISYTFKRLAFQDWTIFNERYSQQKVVGQTPDSRDSEQGRAMAQMVADFNGDMGIVLYNSQPGDKPPISLIGPKGTASVEIFDRFLDRQDRKMTVIFRGSDLRNMSREKSVTGVSAQSDETESMELAHCANIASACHTFIDRMVIRFCFGEGVEPLAYFGLPSLSNEDAKQLRENVGFLADRGALVEADTVAERLGVTLTVEASDALNTVGRASLGKEKRTNELAPDTTANSSRVATLEERVENALRIRSQTQMNPRLAPSHPPSFVGGALPNPGEDCSITDMRSCFSNGPNLSTLEADSSDRLSTTTKRNMKTTPEQRTALVSSKISEHMARGMSYDEAYKVVMKLPEIAEAFEDAQHPQDLVEQERTDQRAAELKSAIEDKMLKHGVDYRTAQKLVEGGSGSDERMAEVLAAVAKLQSELGYDYNKAWETVRRDSRFADMFKAESYRNQ